MGKLSDFICSKNPFCGSIEVTVKDVKISNSEYHGDIWCHLFITDADITSGAKDKIEKEVDALRKKKLCDKECACTSLLVSEFEVKHTRHVHREHVYDSGFLHGNCRVSFDLEFTLAFKVYIGICHDPDFSKISGSLDEWKKLLEQLKTWGEGIKNLTDPDEIWKKIGGVSPKALRESESMEKPRRIHRKGNTNNPK